MRFGLLGELVVTAEDRPLAVGGPGQRALLALLLLHANRSVPGELLVEELWSGRHVDASFSAVKVAVSRLRRATPADPPDRCLVDGEERSSLANRIVTRERGYLIRVEEGELDSIEFERELAAGRAALARGESALALAQLRNALSRWRGPALVEFRDHGWARLDALRLDGLRIEALEERMAAELSLGHHQAVAAELETLVAASPERERLQEHLMIALYRSGRQVEALTAFHRARRHLIDQYGIEPSQRLRGLHDAMLAQDPALELAGATERAANGLSAPEARRSGAITSRLRVQPGSAFVGRGREETILAAALADERGSMQTVLVSGEPGIGKTRLVSEFAARAHERGVAVAGGRCDSGLGLPYQPFVEVLDDLLAWAPSTVVEQHLRVHGPVLARIVPRLSVSQAEIVPLPAREGEGAQFRLFIAVGDLLSQLARQAPLLVVLEDLHWADEPTVLLLKHVLTMPNVDALTLVATYRSTDLEQRPLGGLLPHLHREPGVRRIDLDGLSDAEVIELVQAHLGAKLDQDEQLAACRLRRFTAGNPFFLVQLLQRSSDGEAGATRLALEGAEERLPPSLRETIAGRIGALGENARATLSAAAVAGDEFDLALLRDLVSELGSVPEYEVLSIVEAAIGAQLLIDAGGPASQLAFVHALVPTMLRSELSAARRRALHRAAAQSMERLYGRDGGEHIAALAYHWRQGCEPPVVAPALRTARLAAERATEKLAPAEAVRWYRDALVLHSQQPDPPQSERCDLMIDLGEARREAGDAGFRRTLLDAARLAERLQDSERLVRATLANTRGFTSATGEIDTERVEMLQAALTAISDADSPERARLMAAQAVELAFCGDRETPGRLSAQALAMARRCGEDAALVPVLTTRFFAIWVPDTLATRLAESAENVRLCERLGDAPALSQALHWRANACIEACDMAGARDCVERQGELSRRLREPTAMWLAAYNDANLVLARGQLDEAERLALRALELGQRSGQPDALPVFAAQLANLRFQQGRLGELVPLVKQVLSEHAGITGFRALLALALWECEEPEQARRATMYDAERDFTQLSYDVTWLSVVCIYAHVCARLGERGAARTLYDLLAPWREQVAVSVVAWGCVAHYRGMLATTLGEFACAERHLDHAHEMHEQMCAPVWSAQTRLEIGRMLAARGRPGDGARASSIAAQALDSSQRLGAATVTREARALLEALPCNREHIGGDED